MSELLTIQDCAKRYKVSTMTIRRWWYAKVFPEPIKIRGVLRWRSDAIDSWLESQNTYSAEDAQKPSD